MRQCGCWHHFDPDLLQCNGRYREFSSMLHKTLHIVSWLGTCHNGVLTTEKKLIQRGEGIWPNDTSATTGNGRC